MYKWLVIRTQASWYSRFIFSSVFSLTQNVQPWTIPTNSSFWPILKFPFASTISESMMIYRLLFLAALLGIANAVESCYYCVSPIMKSWAKISFNIILLILAVRIIAIFILIDLLAFIFWWWMFDPLYSRIVFSEY